MVLLCHTILWYCSVGTCYDWRRDINLRVHHIILTLYSWNSICYASGCSLYCLVFIGVKWWFFIRCGTKNVFNIRCGYLSPWLKMIVTSRKSKVRLEKLINDYLYFIFHKSVFDKDNNCKNVKISKIYKNKNTSSNVSIYFYYTNIFFSRRIIMKYKR